MLITHEMIATAEAYGACRPALAWLRAAPRTIEELVYDHEEFAGWALQLPGFMELLDDELFDALVHGAPDYALQYAIARLTEAQFAYCVAEAPDHALKYAHQRLTEAQFDEYSHAWPVVAARVAPDRVSEAVIARVVRSCPIYALTHVKHRLSPEQIKDCESSVWSSRQK